MKPTPYARNAAVGILGLVFGGGFLWLALQHVDGADLGRLLTTLDPAALGAALALYWVSIGFRVVRWAVLLDQLGFVRISRVAETLIVGYAVNNILPARLGEVFRADYAKRRFAIGRAKVLGSILVERLADLGVILLMLFVGLAATGARLERGPLASFELVAVNAAVVIGVVLLGIYFVRAGEPSKLPLPAAVVALLNDLKLGVKALNRTTVVIVLGLSVTVWTFEVLALWYIFAALAVNFSGPEMLLIMGAASLSTLVPTAPGYIGTYQLVFVMALGAFGVSAGVGVVASSAVQLVLFGTLTLAGMLLWLLRALTELQRNHAP